MSDRRLSDTNNFLRDKLRDLEDRLYRLENGGATRGAISLGDTIYIGVVQLQVVDLGVGSVVLVFTNTTTGASYSITL